MGLQGTVIGGLIGGMIGNLPGILIGAGIGAYVTRDKTQEQNSGREMSSAMPDVHLVALFRCLGKLAKADGLVSQDEADFAKSLLHEMEIDPQIRRKQITSFSEGRDSAKSFRTLVREVAFLFQRNAYPNLMEMFCVMALADGTVSAQEKMLLHDAERAFGLHGYTDSYFATRGFGGNAGSAGNHASPPPPQDSLDEAYKTLGIASSASDDEVKKAWRKKALEFHPDKVQGKGLPDAFVQFANEETRRVNDAYDRISKARGMK